MSTFNTEVVGHATMNEQAQQSSTSKTEPLNWTAFCNIINGRLETTTNTRCSINPATEEKNPQVPVSTTEDVERAMTAAAAAFKQWAASPYVDRQNAVFAFADALEVEKENFSKMLVQEQGKPVRVPHQCLAVPIVRNSDEVFPDPICQDGDGCGCSLDASICQS
jgi:delta 1-pyrroline-5-carboxylate dehydrogenase